RIWRSNRQFILKLRDELKAAIRTRDFESLADVQAWFHTRLWRETLMGRFLAKQGIAAGYAYGLSVRESVASFTWLTAGFGEVCDSCKSRDGKSFTYIQLSELGFPGSIQLDCGANCRCSIEPE